MIRRDALAPDGIRHWILIAQIDHAHLAGQLAEHWGAGGVAPLVDRDELLWAVFHHDDGWRSWDAAPDVDPAHSVPRAFNEMLLNDSLAIWTRSIRVAAEHGPLAGYVVAGHFCALLRRFGHWQDDPNRAREAEAFLAHNDTLRADCLARWCATAPGANTSTQAELALAQLQMFDLLSLWLCCEAVDQPDLVETPAGPNITLSPFNPPNPAEPICVEIEPWPLRVERLNLEIRGQAVPVGAYPDCAALAAAPAHPARLQWILRPATAKS